MKLLNTTGSNIKIKKTIKAGGAIRVASLSLMPHRKICAGSKAAKCFEPCLKSSGRGVFKTVAAGRQAKTDFFLSDRSGFLAQLHRELTNFDRLCIKQGVEGWVRLNTISDIDYENYGIPQAFPKLNFLDYTKRIDRSDIINVKAGGVIVGLLAKGKAKKDTSGFVVDAGRIPAIAV